MVKISRMLEKMTINDDDTIINNDSNFSTDSLNKKSLDNKKRNKSINMVIII